MKSNIDDSTSYIKLQRKHDQYHIFVALVSIASFIALGTVLFHFLEGWHFAESFYFSVVTLMTVGYGDLHPTTDFSRIVTAVYVLIGVGITLSSITVIATDRINSAAASMRDGAKARKGKKQVEKDNE
ncbi:MAG: potassium channel family protein [bacterium]|nr:potassium channel family protein [bacterium]